MYNMINMLIITPPFFGFALIVFFASCIKHASRENILVVLSAVFTLITHFHLVVFTCMFLKRKIHEAFVFPENDEIFSELFTV